MPVVIGTALILAFARHGTIVAKILSSKLLLGVGLISYSLYLWHQPLFVFARLYFGIEALHGWHYVGLSGLAIVLAVFSWFFIEQPFRKKSKQGGRVASKIANRQWLFKAAALSGAALITTGFSSLMATKSYQADNPYYVEPELASAPNFGLSRRCTVKSDEACFFGKNTEMLLFGDSFAFHLADALKNSPSAISFRQLAAPGCPPVFNFVYYRHGNVNYPAMEELCQISQQKITQILPIHKEMKYVVISARFYQMIEENRYYLIDGQSHAGSMELAVPKLREILEFLIKQGKKPVLVSTRANNGRDPKNCLEKAFYNKTSLSACDASLQSVLTYQNTKNEQALMEQVQDLAPVIHLRDFLCDAERCKVTINNYPLYLNPEHFTIKGSAYLGKEIDLYGIVKQRADSFSYPQLDNVKVQ